MKQRDILIGFGLLFLIIFFSLIPLPSHKASRRLQIDKIGHLIFYTLWGYFTYPILGGFAIFFGIILGLMTEFLQRYIPNREPGLIDFLFNLIGIGMGICIRLWRSKTK